MAKIKGEEVRIALGRVTLDGILTVPETAGGVVLFAHGSGSSRLSPRNTFVADVLHEAGFGTLLFDLLTQQEDVNFATRFDINLLTERLLGATVWLRARPEGQNRPLGYFGASTGAAAALQGAAELGTKIKAVVSRGGRPDLAMAHLAKVAAPTLLIVGELDREVIQLNRLAYDKLGQIKQLTLVPGATHLFEEPGTLAEAARLAKDWFVRYLR